jgi:hypothetical protein
LQLAQRWVAWRAIDLGWSKKKHLHVERNFSGWGGGRTDHAIERIGKKYQWIAYWELVGYLTDHHWHMDWEKKPAVLDDLEKFDALDIDVSFLLTEEAAAELSDPRAPSIGIPPTNFRAAGDASDLAWIATTDGLPHIPAIVEHKDQVGFRWWLTRAYRSDDDYLNKLQTEGPLRTGQFWIELILISSRRCLSYLAKFAGRTSRVPISLNPSILSTGSSGFTPLICSRTSIRVCCLMPSDRQTNSDTLRRP